MQWWIPERGPEGPGSPLLLDQNETRKVHPAPPPPPPLSPAESLDPPLDCLGFIYALTSINVHRVLVLLFRKVKSIWFADYSDPLEASGPALFHYSSWFYSGRETQMNVNNFHFGNFLPNKKRTWETEIILIIL